MGLRGPYTLHTKGMSPEQARRWFEANPGHRVSNWAESDLGPDIKVPMGKIHKHCTRGRWEDLEVRGREWYHQGHLTRSIG